MAEEISKKRSFKHNIFSFGSEKLFFSS